MDPQYERLSAHARMLMRNAMDLIERNPEFYRYVIGLEERLEAANLRVQELENVAGLYHFAMVKGILHFDVAEAEWKALTKEERYDYLVGFIKEPHPECTCTLDGTPYCKARGTGYCLAENPNGPTETR